MAVYFLAWENDGPIKVGYTADVLKRLRALHSWVPFDFQVLATLPGGDKGTEAYLHAKFSHLHHKREWYRRGADLLALIDSVAAGTAPKLPTSYTEAVRRTLNVDRLSTLFETDANGLADLVKMRRANFVTFLKCAFMNHKVIGRLQAAADARGIELAEADVLLPYVEPRLRSVA